MQLWTVPKIQDWLVARLATLCDLAPDAIGSQEPFVRYGLESRGLTALAGELAALLGKPVSPTLLWKYPSPRALAEHLGGAIHMENLALPADRIGREAREPIAIVGVACRFPGADGPEAFWRLLRDGRDAITDVPADRWDGAALYDADPAAPGRASARKGGFLDRIDAFDAEFFDISPREAAHVDPQQRLMLELAWEALEDAGIPPRELRDSRTGVFVGAMWSEYGAGVRAAPERIGQHTLAGGDPGIIPARVSYALGLRGPSLHVNTACSSSLVAVHLAVQSLRDGECGLAIVGGVSLMLAPDTMIALSKLGALSADGHSKAFDARADGYGRGEGGGVVVLKPLRSALADGDSIRGVIRGSAVNNDGASNGLTAPNPQAQEEVLRSAYARAEVIPGDVQYVEAHGTGTRLGDPIEAGALSAVLGAGRLAEKPLRLGSVKANIGHLEAAAGIAGLIKVVLAMRHRALPPSLWFDRPNPYIPFADWGLQVQTALEDWRGDAEGRLLAGVSAFGFGGTNCHVVLEGGHDQPTHLLALAENTEEALRQRVSALEEATEDLPALARACASAVAGAGRHRLALCVRDRIELVRAARSYLEGRPIPGVSSMHAEGGPPRIVFAFGGQGSQWPGMAADLLREEPVFRAALRRCDAIMAPHIGRSLVDLLASADDTWLEITEVAQPAIFAMQVALAELWRSWGIEPDAVVGTSMGEVTAAYVCGALDLETAATLMCVRSRIASRLAGKGAMAVLDLPAEDAREMMRDFENRVWVAGIAGPRSTVLSGDRTALRQIVDRAAARSIRCALIRVNYASHSPYTDEVLPDLREALAGLRSRPGRIPFYSSVTGARMNGAELDTEHWLRTERTPWQLSTAVEALLGDGYELFLDVDPHPVLTEAIQQSSTRAIALASLRRGQRGRAALFDSLGALHARGVPVSWESLYPTSRAPVLLVLSARSESARMEAVQAMANWLPEQHDTALHDIGYTAAARRSHHEHRVAVTASSHDAMAAALHSLAQGDRQAHVSVGFAAPAGDAKVVFVFSGQGTQWAGMGRVLLEREPVFRAAVQACDDWFEPLAGWSLLTELATPPEGSRLADTAVAQPALFAIQVGLAALWRSWGITPSAVMGHSVGEIAAAHVAGALSLEEAIRIVHHRGACMRRAAGLGGMAAVELPEASALALLDVYGDRLSIAAVNDRASVVLSGEHAALASALEKLRGDGIHCRELRVDYAFHSAQMAPFQDELVRALGAVSARASEVPLYSTVTGAEIAGEQLDADYWAADIRRAVRFADAVDAAISTGHRIFLEIGAHPVLSANVEQCLSTRGQSGCAVPSLRRGEDDRAAMLRSLGVLYTQGLDVRFDRVFGETGRRVTLPRYPWQRERHWIEPPRTRLPETDPLAGLLYTLDWRRQEHLAPAPSSRSRSWLLFVDGGGTGEALAAELRARGEHCVLVHARDEQPIDAVLRDAFGSGPPPAGVVYLWGLDAESVERITGGALELVRALSRRGWRDAPRLWLITRAAQPAGTPVLSPAQASLWGIGRTMALEHPPFQCTRIDLPAVDEETAIRLARELTDADRETDIALRSDGRYVARLVQSPADRVLAAPGASSLRDDGTYIIAGSDGAMTESLSAWMRQRGARHIVVVGEPSRATEVAQVFAEIARSMPDVRGVVHASSSEPLADRCAGAWQLHTHTQGMELDFFVLYSNAAALLGDPAHAEDTAAGAFLDALAHHRRALGLPALSIGWGSVTETETVLNRLLFTPLPHVAVLALNPRQWFESHPSAAGRPMLSELVRAPAARKPDAFRQALLAARPENRAAMLEEHLRTQLSLTLQRDSAKLHRSTPFRNMGLESLMAVELRNRLESSLGVRLSVALLFTHSTIAELAPYLLSQLGLQKAPNERPSREPAHATTEPIAIIGMGCRLPGGVVDPESFWQLLEERVDAVTEVPAERWATPAHEAARWGAFLSNVDGFDAEFFGISPREAKAMDPQQRLLLEVAWEALERAGQPPDRLTGSRTGVFVGLVVNDYDKVSRTDRDIYTVTGNGHAFPAGRLSYQLGLQGPSMTVDTACSSSLVAIHLACQSLRSGESTLALAGGVNLLLSPDMSNMLAGSRALSPDGRCRTFDAMANGYVRGEGCGVLVLERLSDALANGHPVLALIRGSAVNSDGRSAGLTAPNVTAQTSLLRQTLGHAGVDAREIAYVETHGTGTPLGDPIEFEALTQVLGEPRPDGSTCVLGAVKTNIGHLEAAAGVAGVIKVVLAMQREHIPANLHLQTLNPRITLSGTPFVVPVDPIPWAKREGRPRLAGVSSFGISGTNAHVILGEPPERDAGPELPHAPCVVLVSARTAPALRELAGAYPSWLARQAWRLEDIASTAALRRQHHEHRAAFVVSSREELTQRTEALARGEISAGVVTGQALETRPMVVFVFPGQGSQWIGMGRELYEHEPVFRAALRDCDAALRLETGWSVIDELHTEPSLSRLEHVDVVQPVLFAMEIALAALWRGMGVEPDAVIGHSMGEVAAAHVAGALSMEDAARIIVRRSRLLGRISGRGAMALVELPLAEAERALSGVADRVSVAASNSPRSTVISGDAGALEEVLATLTEAGVFCRRIKVSVASHSPQVDPLTEDLLDALSEIMPVAATIPMHSTVTGQPCEGTELDARYWVRNLRAPVLFARAVQERIDRGPTVFLELSPHPILLPAIDDMMTGVTYPSLRRDHGERHVFLESLAGLHVRGYPVNWRARDSQLAQCVPLPTYPWQRQRHWVETAPPPEQNPGGHALLGDSFGVATQPGLRIWEGEVRERSPAYLADHRVKGATVLPAAACVEMVLHAARQAHGPGPHVLQEIDFERMVTVTATSVQLILEPSSQGRIPFQSFYRNDTEWARFATGFLCTDADVPPSFEPSEQVRGRCPIEVPATEHYDRHRAHAIDYGPAFQGMQRMWIGNDEAIGRVVTPVEPGSHVFHPALLDACFQVFGGMVLACRPDPSGAALVPVAIGRLRVHRRAGDGLWVHAKLHPGSDDIGDLVVLDDEGRLIAEIQGLRVRKLAGRDPSEDWFYELVWRAADPPRPASRPAGTWLVLADRGGIGEALAARLIERGQSVVSLPDPLDDEGWDRRLDAFANGRACAGIVHLWSLDSAALEHTTAETLATDTRRSALGTLALVRAISRRGWRDTPRLWLVTQGVHDPARPSVAQAPLWGFARTLAMEHPEFGCVRVDLAAGWPQVEAANRLLPELLGPDGADEIALRADGRHAARWVRRAPVRETNAIELRSDATYLITGGLGGLGLGLAAWMAERGARHLVLLGRRGASPQVSATIETIRQAGVDVRVERADVTRHEDVARVLDTIDARMPPLRGVVHAAMVLDDRTVLELEPERFDRVLAPKVQGAWNLHAQTLGRRLDFFVLYSSAAAVLGSPGQANYAAANAFLGALARHRKAMGEPALCIDWGLFAEAGIMADRQAEGSRLASRGVGTITPAQGATILGRLLRTDTTHVAVLNLHFRQWLQFYPSAAASPLFEELKGADQDTGHASAFAERLAAAAPGAHSALVESLVTEHLGRILQLDSARIDRAMAFTRMGVDSLMALELRNRLEASLGIRLSVTLLFAFPTVSALTVQLLDKLGLHSPAPSTEDLDHLDMDELLAQLDSSLDRIEGGTEE
ncbi:SDR family NAD(P)-dependent oxidoreductase [Pendulispora brunnea]|uniref:SDR family NAD(P)-dependent oxidoreductase n=1 Tax=Pendulispora brunnea TaxID=2905690 RepID=A0ABZ2KDE7_9BACT